MRITLLRSFLLTSILLAVCASPSRAQVDAPLSTDLQNKIDAAANDVLHDTGVPSASVAIVKNGKIAFLQAYGKARLEPPVPAKPDMRYAIGSISKQFTASAILMLQEEGKLSLDDKVAKFIPDLTRANEVTIRQLLSHTSGYQDYYPQDYTPPLMMKPTTAAEIMDRWARKPLDFDPGTKWQYSNTNYVIAGAIVEKVSGTTVFDFLQKRVFAPIGMNEVANVDQKKLGDTDPTGYMRYGLGHLRPTKAEAPGWMFAAGELAMPASELAKWDISIIDQKLLKPESYKQLETEVVLKNGVGTRYGLGVEVLEQSGHRVLEHSGEVSGFTAENVVYPDDRDAIIVLTNQDAASAASDIAHRIQPLLLNVSDPATPAKLEEAKKIFAGLQNGTVDRSLFTEDANFYFSEQALQDFRTGLAPLGSPQDFIPLRHGLRGGMMERVYSVKFPKQSLRVWTYEMPDGKLEQYQVAPE
ncbi:MAG TPA: serine hydrolase domain-containing protein [Terriglobales bacterium]|nr:serine hydrolase domain-containing protein [Terriglobales bacterium]